MNALRRCCHLRWVESRTSRDIHVTVPLVTFDLRKVELVPLEQRKLTFDSHTMVTELESNGFEKRQAELIISALVTLSTANMDIVYKDMVTKSHQKMRRELEQLQSRLKEESQKVRAETKLDINLESSRISDMKADLENDNMEINKKIDLQVASLKTVLESLKLETIRYLAVCVCLPMALQD
ncbi:hypothetical protein INR49_032272 [Caranx melampygus]|nr:hypothetical protein INR49_032272 [Caranx melampygus]